MCNPIILIFLCLYLLILITCLITTYQLKLVFGWINTALQKTRFWRMVSGSIWQHPYLYFRFMMGIDWFAPVGGISVMIQVRNTSLKDQNQRTLSFFRDQEVMSTFWWRTMYQRLRLADSTIAFHFWVVQ